MRRSRTRVSLLAALLFVGALILSLRLVEARGPTAEITFNDSDDIVSPGTDLEVRVWVRDPDQDETYTLSFVHAAGGPVVIDDGGVQGMVFSGSTNGNSDGDLGPLTLSLIVPLGSPYGTATISARIDVEGGDPLALATRELEVGDAGDPIASAVLAPSTEMHEPRGEKISTSLKRGKIAYLKLTIKNSLGNETNDADVSSILIVGTQAIMGRGGDPPSAENTHVMRYQDGTDPSADAFTEFSLKPSAEEFTHIEVRAIVVGRDGHATSNTLELNFAGAPAELFVAETSGNLAAVDGEVRVVISGRDSVGNLTEVRSRNVQARVIEGPEDANFSRIRVKDQQCKKDDVDCELEQVVILLETTSRDADHGHYVIQIELTNTPAPVETTAEIIVVGEAVFLSLELYKSTDPGAKQTFGKDRRGLLFYVPGQGENEELIVEEGEVVIAAVVLRDEFGELVAASSPAVEDDGVTFEALGSMHMLPLTSGEQEIERGVATARFLVTGASGHALVVASNNELHDLVRLLPQAENVRGFAGLTSIAADDLSVWIAPNSTPISELFDELSRRGIRTMYLWSHSERRWLRYDDSESAESAPVNDFLVRTGGILWLSSSATAQPPVIGIP